MTIQPVTADIARSMNLPSVKGALVNGVEPGSPADNAGLKTGDVITKFNGQAIDNGNDLRNLVASTAPGSKATVTIVRDGRSQDITVQLANARARCGAQCALGRGQTPTRTSASRSSR